MASTSLTRRGCTDSEDKIGAYFRAHGRQGWYATKSRQGLCRYAKDINISLGKMGATISTCTCTMSALPICKALQADGAIWRHWKKPGPKAWCAISALPVTAGSPEAAVDTDVSPPSRFPSAPWNSKARGDEKSQGKRHGRHCHETLAGAP